MVTKAEFKLRVDNSILNYYMQYGKSEYTRRMFLESYSNLLTGLTYSKLPGSSQQTVRKGSKRLYDSETDALTHELLVKIFMASDYKSRALPATRYVLRTTDTRFEMRSEPQQYNYYKTKSDALEAAGIKKKWPYIAEIVLMQEKYPNQKDRNYSYLKKLK